MVEEKHPKIPPDDSPLRDLLSREELRELLSPVSDSPELVGESRDPYLLLLTEDPEDVEVVASLLKARGLSVLPVANRYAAIDQFRTRSYLGVLSTVEALASEAELFLRRIRETAPEVRLAFIVRKGAASSKSAKALASSGPLVERPLTAQSLSAFFDAWLPQIPAVRAERPAVVEPPARQLEPAAGPSLERPDPLILVGAYLEARLAGGDLPQALEAWAKADPSVLGVLRAERGASPGELTLRTNARSEPDAVQMLAEAAGLFAAPGAKGELRELGRFLTLALTESSGHWLALCARAGAAGVPWNASRRLGGVLELIERVSKNTPRTQAPADATEQVREYLEVRMRSCERHNQRIGLLMIEAAPNSGDLREIALELRGRLRGCDYAKSDSRRLMVVLDRPDRGWQASLLTRLKPLRDSKKLRIVGALWNPPSEDARGLVQRVETLLASRPPGPLLEFLDASS